jgi:hypothetical protein
VYRLLKERNLVYIKDKRVFRVDKEISQIFNIPMSVNQYNEVHENGFNFRNIQSYINKYRNSIDE